MAVFFESASDGGLYNADPISWGPAILQWNHYGGGPDRAVLVAVSYMVYAGNTTDLIRTVTYGGRAMTSLGVIASPSGSGDPGFTELFGITDAGSGKAGIKVVVDGVWLARRKVRAAAVSYTGVDSFSTVTTASGTGTALSVAATGDVAGMCVAVFGTEGGLVNYTQSQRYLSNSKIGLAVGDALGTGSSTTFSVTRSRSNKWGAVAVKLVAADVIGIVTPVIGEATIAVAGRRLPRPGVNRRTVFSVPLD